MFGKLFGKKQTAAVLTEAPPCPHAVLVARWDSVQDMGREDKATHFMCEACHQMFTPEEAVEVRKGIADKLVGQEESKNS